ncbi:MAG: head-tail connector protein [Anaerolineae bacterium]|nr:head-tail connector protein [Anaerolineae bacterium]
MTPYVITAPVGEPVSISDAKTHLRIDLSDDDALLGAYITAARQKYEELTWRALMTQTLGQRLALWPSCDHIALRRPPLQSVTSVTYTDSDGNAGTLASSDYNVYANGDAGLIWLKHGKSWPSVTLQPGPSILITYVAGYGGAEDVPEIDRQAIRLLVGHFYENRENVVAIQGITVAELPMAVRSIVHLRRAW